MLGGATRPTCLISPAAAQRQQGAGTDSRGEVRGGVCTGEGGGIRPDVGHIQAAAATGQKPSFCGSSPSCCLSACRGVPAPSHAAEAAAETAMAAAAAVVVAAAAAAADRTVGQLAGARAAGEGPAR